MEEQVKKFLALTQARQDRLAQERDALLAAKTHEEKASWYNGYEAGLIVAGRQAEAAAIAADLQVAFGK